MNYFLINNFDNVERLSVNNKDALHKKLYFAVVLKQMAGLSTRQMCSHCHGTQTSISSSTLQHEQKVAAEQALEW